MTDSSLKHTRTTHGFTLMELAIVLAIVALITGMAISSGVSLIETARQTSTDKKMASIDQALLAYRTAHDRLPCPANLTIAPGATNYGVEAASPSGIFPGSNLCSGGTPAANFTSLNAGSSAPAAAEGTIPVATLNLPSDMMYDGWGNHIRYAVDTAMTVVGSFTTYPTGAICGGITVKDTNGAARSSGAIYALISHGPNGHGAYTQSGVIKNAISANTNEQTNCHCDATATATTYAPTYVQMVNSLDTSNGLNSFDDIVSYKERWQLQAPQDKGGSSVCPAIYIADTTNTRIQKLDIMNTNYLAQFGTSGSGIGQFSSSGTSANGALPGITVDKDGYIWVTDVGNNRVQKFDNTGTWQLTIGGNAACKSCTNPSSCSCASGSGIGMFNKPTGIASDSSGNVWVADYVNNRVQKFTSNGYWILTIGGGASCSSCTSTTSCTCASGTSNSAFNSPYYVAVDASDNLWVSDSANHRIQKFNSSGGWLQSVPSSGTSSGTGVGKFNTPRGIFVDVAGYIWVMDTYNSRIQKLDANGNWLQTVGGGASCSSCSSPSSCTCTGGSSDGQFQRATGLAVTPFGTILPVDCSNNHTQLYDNVGNYLSYNAGGTTSSGSGNAQFACPSGVAISR